MPMYNVKFISKNSKYFPKNLLDLPDCPEILFIIGNEKILNNTSVSIVGTRNSSESANKIAFDLSQKLSSAAISIVSGLANGIDENAHQGTFNCGKTIAIIASGFNHISNSKLYLVNQIIANGGTIISEYFPDVPPQKYSFLKRNRLIASFSRALIVVQAPSKSGSLNTAKTAKALGRTIFAVPWNIDTFRGIGCNNLIENGARILTSHTQVLESLNYKFTNLTNINTQDSPIPLINEITIPTEYKKLYEFIQKNEPCPKNIIYSKFSNENIADLNSKLTLMELENLIRLQRKYPYHK